MADLEVAIFSRLTTFAGLSALISTRCYPVVAPQNPTAPYVTYTRIDGPRESALSEDMGLPHPRMQIDCWAETYAGVRAVALQVRLAMQRWGPATVAGVEVLDALLDGEQDSYEDSVKLFRTTWDFIVWHRE